MAGCSKNRRVFKQIQNSVGFGLDSFASYSGTEWWYAKLLLLLIRLSATNFKSKERRISVKTEKSKVGGVAHNFSDGIGVRSLVVNLGSLNELYQFGSRLELFGIFVPFFIVLHYKSLLAIKV